MKLPDNQSFNSLGSAQSSSSNESGIKSDKESMKVNTSYDDLVFGINNNDEISIDESLSLKISPFKSSKITQLQEELTQIRTWLLLVDKSLQKIEESKDYCLKS